MAQTKQEERRNAGECETCEKTKQNAITSEKRDSTCRKLIGDQGAHRREHRMKQHHKKKEKNAIQPVSNSSATEVPTGEISQKEATSRKKKIGGRKIGKEKNGRGKGKRKS